jgi:ribonuclease HII
MIEHDGAFPHYGWVRNKGYASEEHRDAILSHGPSELHRHTWLSKMMAAPLADPAIALDGLDAVDGLEPLGATADGSAA